MTTVAKPSVEYDTPYKILLDDLNNFFEDNSDKIFSPDYSQPNNEVNLTEQNTDIETPELLFDNIWQTKITSVLNDLINPFTVQFNTVDILDFIKGKLELDKRTYRINKLTSDKYGFYIAGDSDYAVVRLPKSFNFDESIKFNGIEIPLDMYTFNKQNSVLIINAPIVKGSIYVDRII